MKHYEPTSVKRQHAAAKTRLAEIEQEIARIGNNRGLNERYRDQLLQPLLQEQTALENEIWSMENSHAWQTATEAEKMWAAAARERALLDRVKARQDRIQAEREAYQRQVDQIDWSLVSLPDEARRQIAHEHLAKMAKMAERRAALASPEGDAILVALAAKQGISPAAIREATRPKSFETKAQDKLTGQNYVLITDADGFTYAMHDLTGAGGDSGEDGNAA